MTCENWIPVSAIKINVNRQGSPVSVSCRVNKVGNPKLVVREWVVTVRQRMKIGARKVADTVDQNFYVQAKTAASARRAIKSAGYRGEIVDVQRST